MAKFGQTPRETIAEAFRKATDRYNISWPQGPVPSDRLINMHVNQSHLLNLLDVLSYVALVGESMKGSLADSKEMLGSIRGRIQAGEWARNLRISILASLGLEENGD